MSDLLDKAEAEGALARLNKEPREANPYTEPLWSDHAVMWDVGWLEGTHSEALQRWFAEEVQ